LALTVATLPFLQVFGSSLAYLVNEWWLPLSLVYAAVTHVLIFFLYKRRIFVYQVAWRAALLGQGLGVGLMASFLSPLSWRVFGWYFTLLTLFHFSEYMVTALIKPKSLSLDSFLLCHSTEYAAAAVLSWLEFSVERYFFPNMKQFWALSVFGLVLCVAGEFVRKLAMFTAGSNFNHIVQTNREEGHVLVTHGIYAWSRHPSYMGWFYWSIGTQLVLVNPVCTVGYALASWNFFKSRISDEEITLLNFFGGEYVTYQRTVKTGLPFIEGYRVEL
jgi:protein-S-isoprenylcysteine O-methyltransferase